MAFKTVQVDETPSNVLPAGKAASALTAGQPVYLSSAGVWTKAAASLESVAFASRLYAVGFMWKDCQANEVVEPVRCIHVRDTALTLTIGGYAFLSATAGAITQTAPDSTYANQLMGIAVSATEYFLSIAPPELAEAGQLVPASGISMPDATNIATGTTTGTKFGVTSVQKVGFFGVTPVVQPAVITGSDSTAVAAILSALQTVGIISAA